MKLRKTLLALSAAAALAASTAAATPAMAQTSDDLLHQSAVTSSELYQEALGNPLTQGSTVFLTVGSGGLWLIGCMIQDFIAPGTADCSF
ncbi:hypothetical protein [Corynebacterium sp. A21]|uniref:hypothetical protein n=1 Tax=Corynebacterium sp. A21 TaxID=3457318 RepID=UPI003FD4DFA4